MLCAVQQSNVKSNSPPPAPWCPKTNVLKKKKGREKEKDLDIAVPRGEEKGTPIPWFDTINYNPATRKAAIEKE